MSALLHSKMNQITKALISPDGPTKPSSSASIHQRSHSATRKDSASDEELGDGGTAVQEPTPPKKGGLRSERSAKLSRICKHEMNVSFFFLWHGVAGNSISEVITSHRRTDFHRICHCGDARRLSRVRQNQYFSPGAGAVQKFHGPASPGTEFPHLLLALPQR